LQHQAQAFAQDLTDHFGEWQALARRGGVGHLRPGDDPGEKRCDGATIDG
jgi:hypothetical protein